MVIYDCTEWSETIIPPRQLVCSPMALPVYSQVPKEQYSCKSNRHPTRVDPAFNSIDPIVNYNTALPRAYMTKMLERERSDERTSSSIATIAD